MNSGRESGLTVEGTSHAPPRTEYPACPEVHSGMQTPVFGLLGYLLESRVQEVMNATG